MDENGCGGCLFPSDSCPDWLTFNCEGSSVMFEVPQVEGCTLKTLMICIDYSSTLDNITSNGLANLLVKNYTKATIQLYKREALASFEDEEGQRVVSSIEPCNKVEVVVVFENGFIVKKTTVYLVYDEPIGEKMEQYCQEQEEIVCSGDEDECFVREVSSNAQEYNVIVSSSGDENECVVRNVSPQVVLAPMEDLQHNRRKKIFKWRWKTVLGKVKLQLDCKFVILMLKGGNHPWL
ncbi:hypothetical protein MTR_6g015595 [Medicago truncatula]|uniref:Uncharacterized protein n=1 Tax=Medicago truncatula TaxID=3880 RepID=A0A072UH18_MEDTR|nr:hypothetical protein MTR_6g015595 [Medicago truncatula]